MRVERQDRKDHTSDGSATGEGGHVPFGPPSRKWVVIAVAVASVSLLASYWLGLNHEWRDPLFVAPFLAVAAIAVAYGATMSAKAGLACTTIIALATVMGFGLGLQAGHSLDDPVIHEGYITWVSGSLLVVPVAWLIGEGIGRLRHRPAATMNRDA